MASAGAAALSACAAATPGGQQAGGSAPAESGAPAAASGEAVQLEYYFATGGAPKNVEVMQGLFARFTEAHPEITVEPVVAPQGVTSAQKLQTMVAGGVPPDLVYTGASVSFAARGVYLDLFPLLEKAGRSLEDQHPNARAVYTIKGGSFLWGLPNHLSGHFLCVNKTLFDQAGVPVPSTDWADPTWTWSKFLEVADAVTQRDGDTATAWGCRSFGSSLYYTGPVMFGGRWYDKETMQCTCDEEPAYKGFQYDHDLIYTHRVAPTPAEGQALEGGFLTGKLAITYDGPWSIATYTTIQDFEWTLAPVPYADGLDVNAPRLNPAFCNALAIASKDQVDASWTLLEWLEYTDDIYAEWCWFGAGRLPSRVAVTDKWLEYANDFDSDVAWSVYVDAYDYASEDWDAKQVNQSRLYDLVIAEYIDPLQQQEDAVAKELAVAIKPKIQELLEEV
ncbi:MAG: extracellular solute-binding protein [Anaerolineae bacterium]